LAAFGLSRVGDVAAFTRWLVQYSTDSVHPLIRQSWLECLLFSTGGGDTVDTGANAAVQESSGAQRYAAAVEVLIGIIWPTDTPAGGGAGASGGPAMPRSNKPLSLDELMGVTTALQTAIATATGASNEGAWSAVGALLADLDSLAVTSDLLAKTGLGKIVNGLRKTAAPPVQEQSRALVKKWKTLMSLAPTDSLATSSAQEASSSVSAPV